ncbi:MAG TPA: penicillin-binding protein 2 [Actinomycetes bacterium]|nr:penicillin-binding protein 2 [Actinomycetes bacterium]
MIRPLRRMTLLLGLLFFSLLVQATRVQVIEARHLQTDTGNIRPIIAQYGRERGAILVGPAPVARSVDTGDARLRYERRYPMGPLYSAATGFYSLVYGATGIERAEDPILSGTDPRLLGSQFSDLIQGQARKGGSVLLTLNAAAQQAAYDGLRKYRGAVVAIEPSTGRILALVSSPSFDPNPLSANNAKTETTAWNAYTKDSNQPLLNRPLAKTYPPGSSFKIVTAAAALSSGKYTMTTEIPAPAALQLPQSTKKLPNYDNRPCFGGKVTLEQALQISCNTAMANVGLTLGDQTLREQAEKFGFNHTFQVPMTAAQSVFPADLNAPQTALAAIGQYDVRATALQMAMVAAGVANHGLVMKPYLVEQVNGPDLAPLSRTEPQEFDQAVTPLVASELTAMLVNVVDNGTGRPARIPGVQVAGKTGTAQTSPGHPPHAWFVAFAPAQDPKVAVAVVVEDGGNLGSEATGGKLSAPIAKAVIQAVLK